jgi:hypothetical protein
VILKTRRTLLEGGFEGPGDEFFVEVVREGVREGVARAVDSALTGLYWFLRKVPVRPALGLPSCRHEQRTGSHDLHRT